jgi:hypothetical protein
MISTLDLSQLPDAKSLCRVLQAMAMLDAILCPEWEYRYYSFNSKWSTYEKMGSMRNGSGDDMFALFNEAGCWLKGFMHESIMTPYRNNPVQIWPGIFDLVPTEFADCLKEPAFKIEDSTFCIWRRLNDLSWSKGIVMFPDGDSDPDGSRELLTPLDGHPETYHEWAEKYYEREISLTGVRRIYSHRPLTAELVTELNPDLVFSDLQTDIEEIGYPSS